MAPDMASGPMSIIQKNSSTFLPSHTVRNATIGIESIVKPNA
jgi:hypothetical protein